MRKKVLQTVLDITLMCDTQCECEFCHVLLTVYRETLQLSTFHYLIQLTATYYESMVLEKREMPMARQWAQR